MIIAFEKSIERKIHLHGTVERASSQSGSRMNPLATGQKIRENTFEMVAIRKHELVGLHLRYTLATWLETSHVTNRKLASTSWVLWNDLYGDL